MDESARRRALELVRKLMNGTLDDEEGDEAMRELMNVVPDPHVSDLIFWPDTHRLSKTYDTADLTPELIVDLACQYRPIQL